MKGFLAEIALKKKLSKNFFDLGVAISRRVWL
jgi:hypothetical protein